MVQNQMLHKVLPRSRTGNDTSADAHGKKKPGRSCHDEPVLQGTMCAAAVSTHTPPEHNSRAASLPLFNSTNYRIMGHGAQHADGGVTLYHSIAYAAKHLKTFP